MLSALSLQCHSAILSQQNGLLLFSLFSSSLPRKTPLSVPFRSFDRSSALWRLLHLSLLPHHVQYRCTPTQYISPNKTGCFVFPLPLPNNTSLFRLVPQPRLGFRSPAAPAPPPLTPPRAPLLTAPPSTAAPAERAASHLPHSPATIRALLGHTPPLHPTSTAREWLS